MKTGSARLMVIVIHLLVISNNSFGQDSTSTYRKAVIPKEKFTQIHSGISVSVNDSFTVIDDKYLDSAKWSTIDTIYSVKNRVYLALNLDTTIGFTLPATCNVDLEITKWDEQGEITYEYPSLQVAYDTTKGNKFIYY